MSEPSKALVVVPATRTMRKADYEIIYRLIESGTSKETICTVYGLNAHTLYLRIRKDRPDLAEKIKNLPTSKRVDVNDAAALEAVVKHRGKKTRDNLSTIIEHDTDALADEVREQQTEQAKDPNKKLVPVGLKHARGLLALGKLASMVPGMGLDGGGGAGGKVVINNNVGGHASVMRLGGGDVFADDADIIDAVVEPIEDRPEGQTND